MCSEFHAQTQNGGVRPWSLLHLELTTRSRSCYWMTSQFVASYHSFLKCPQVIVPRSFALHSSWRDGIDSLNCCQQPPPWCLKRVDIRIDVWCQTPGVLWRHAANHWRNWSWCRVLFRHSSQLAGRFISPQGVARYIRGLRCIQNFINFNSLPAYLLLAAVAFACLLLFYLRSGGEL